MTVDADITHLDDLLADTLLLECDEAKVLWLIVLGFVNRAHDLGDGAVLGQGGLYVLLGNTLSRQLADVDLAGLNIGLLDCALLALDGVFSLGGGVNTVLLLEDDKCKAPEKININKIGCFLKVCKVIY